MGPLGAAGFGCAGPGPERQSRGASRGAGSSVVGLAGSPRSLPSAVVLAP